MGFNCRLNDSFLYSVSSAIKQVDIKFDLILIFHMLVYRKEEVHNILFHAFFPMVRSELGLKFKMDMMA